MAVRRSSTTALNGFTGSIALNVTGTPDGATAALTPASVTVGSSSALTIDAGTAAPGTYNLTVTGTGPGGTPVRTTTVTLVVQASAAFSVSASPASRSIARGGSTTYSVTITRAAPFTGTVNLTLAGLPNKASGSFSPVSVTATTSTLTITSLKPVQSGN